MFPSVKMLVIGLVVVGGGYARLATTANLAPGVLHVACSPWEQSHYREGV